MAFGLMISAICEEENSATMLALGSFYPNLLLVRSLNCSTFVSNVLLTSRVEPFGRRKRCLNIFDISVIYCRKRYQSVSDLIFYQIIY